MSAPDLAVVVLLPEGEEQRLDFASREVGGWPGVLAAVEEAVAAAPRWRAITIVHIEDLPAMIEGP